MLRKIFTGSGMVSVLAVLLALILGGLLIASTDKQVAATAGYLFARPTDFLAAVWNAATRSYVALFQGSVFNPRGSGVAGQFAPLMETLTIATPLITAGLGVALAFRAGLFNIGAQGQIIMAGILAAWVGFALHLPVGLHLLLVLVAGIVGGALWGGLVGVLKARTGAHEVILTIMFNYIALYFLRYLLDTPAVPAAGGDQPRFLPILDPTAVYPQIFGSQYRLHLGFLLAIAATVLGLVAAEPVHDRLRIPRRGRQPQGGADRRHQRLPRHHPGDGHRRRPRRPVRRGAGGGHRKGPDRRRRGHLRL